MSRRDATRLVVAGAMLVVLVVFELLFGRFVPNARGSLGHDYEYFLPRLLAGEFFFIQNGWTQIPWFTPFACGGVPAFPNPQDLWFSVPQWLAFRLDPLTAVQATMLIFAAAGLIGTYALLTKRFGVSAPAALLGAMLFGLNGFFGYRMVIGHLTAHGFMLLPAIALLLVGPRAKSEAPRIAFAGLLLGYLVLTAAQFLPPFAFALAAICLMRIVLFGDARQSLLRVASAGLIALGLSAARISAVLHFLREFPRTDYPLPGIPSLAGVFGTALQLLFVGPAPLQTTARLVNGYWAIERHELEYGLTVVPAVIMLAAGTLYVRRFSRDTFSSRRVPWATLAALAAILVTPLALNYYQPAWNHVLKSLPLLGSTSTFFRWFCVYIPVIAIGCALLAERGIATERVRWVIFVIAAIATPLLMAGADTTFYSAQQYNPRELIAADRDVKRTGRVPVIDHVVEYDPHSLIRCAASMACYEPILGYRLEHLPRSDIRPGPVLSEGNTINIRNPACYVFPVDNGCAPGALFRREQRTEAMAFVRYQAFAFTQPVVQRIADWISALTLTACVLFLGWIAVTAMLRRIKSRSPVTDLPPP